MLELRHTAGAALLALTTTLACGQDSAVESVERSKPDSSPMAGSPYELADAIDEARLAPLSDRPAAMAGTRRAWHNRKVSWEVGFLRPMCGHSGTCVVLPRDHARHQTRMPQGWLLELDLTAAQRKQLADRCRAHVPVCVVELRGTLSQFVLATDKPTAVGLSAIELGEVRAPASSESWVRRPARNRDEQVEPQVVLSRTRSMQRETP